MNESVTTCAAVYPVLGGTADQCVLDTCGWEDRRLGEADAKACAAMGLITEEMRLGQAGGGGPSELSLGPASKLCFMLVLRDEVQLDEITTSETAASCRSPEAAANRLAKRKKELLLRW
eukprot:g5008.t1